MGSATLYKYLDINGGLTMLEHHNLQFTNATKFNDPFDCHPALFDYSNVPENQKEEVKYKDILQKPDYFKDHPLWIDLLTTKAKVWEHEQEVRLITKDPAWVHAGRDIPKEFYEEKIVDGKEIRHYPLITNDCFESVYLGVNMLPRNKDRIIETAKKLNPSIKIYQMTIDPEAFRLKEELIQ